MGHRYSNPDPAHRPHGVKALLRWGLLDPLFGRRRVEPPGPPAARVPADLGLVRKPGGPDRLTWIGHASFLLTVGGRSLIIDPVFSLRVGWVYRRYDDPGLRAEELPPLEAVLVTHNHFDHMDAPSLRVLGKDLPVVVPAGLGRWFRLRGWRRVVELEWWQATEVGGLQVTLVPSRHWSRRGVFDTNRTLWGGFVVEYRGAAVYHAGDSASFEGFSEIGRRFPGLLAALLPIGGYRPAWFMEHNHMNPEQAARAYRTLGARYFVPMHWGAFQLTDEPISEPSEWLRAYWKRQGCDGRLVMPAVGETVVLEE